MLLSFLNIVLSFGEAFEEQEEIERQRQADGESKQTDTDTRRLVHTSSFLACVSTLAQMHANVRRG